MDSPIHCKHEEPPTSTKSIWIMRLLFASYWGSLGAIQPYLPIYYHSLQLSGQIIGILGAITPFTTFLVAPIWGIISDKTGHVFSILYLTFIISTIGQLLVYSTTNPWMIMIIVCWTAIVRAPVKPLIDSVVMQTLQDRTQYGRLRLFGQVGFGVGTSVMGFLMNMDKNTSSDPSMGTTTGNAGSDWTVMDWWEQALAFYRSLDGFMIPFLIHGLLSLPAFLCIRSFHHMHHERQRIKKQQEIQELEQQLEAEQERPENDSNTHQEKGTTTDQETRTENDSNSNSNSHNHQTETKSTSGTKTEEKVDVWDGISKLVQNPDVIMFFVLIYVIGFSSGAIENFCYVRMREIGLSGKTLGLSRLLSSCLGAPMFWFSGQLQQYLGAETVLIGTLCSFAARFVLYASMTDAVFGFLAEAIRGLTFGLFWSTAVITSNRMAPPGCSATMPMLLNAVYAGIGNSMGAMIAGKIVSSVGIVDTFLYAAYLDVVVALGAILFLNARHMNVSPLTSLLSLTGILRSKTHEN